MARPSSVATRLRSLFSGRTLLIGTPFLWLLVFFLLPFLIVLRISLAEMDGAMVSDLFTYANNELFMKLKLQNYLTILEDDLYLSTYAQSLKYAGITTAVCLAIGYPFAYFMARSPSTVQPLLLMGVMLPFWTSFLLRVYAWKGLLDADTGWVGTFLNTIGADKLLLPLGLISAEGQYMYTPFSLILGMVYTYLPFMILPLYSVMKSVPPPYLRAAVSLGSSPLAAFFRVYVPQTWSGVGAGALLVFILSIGYYVTPALLGGADDQMLSYYIAQYTNVEVNWGMACALGAVLLAATLILYSVYRRVVKSELSLG